MTTYHPPRVSAFAKRHYGEGFAEGESKGEAKGEAKGEVKGERHTIRMVLKARGLSVTDDQSSLIEACNDLTTLRKWSEAALTAKDASDIFD
jgi:predicted transposase YdaD